MQSSAEKGMQRATDPFRLPPPHANLLVKLGKPEVSHLNVQLAIPAHTCTELSTSQECPTWQRWEGQAQRPGSGRAGQQDTAWPPLHGGPT